MEYLKSELYIYLMTTVCLLCPALSASTRHALHHVSEDLGCNVMYIDEWEDVINNIAGVGGPNDDLEVSHGGGDYLAVCDYYLMRKGR